MNPSMQNKPAGRGKSFFSRAIAALTIAAALFLAGCSNSGNNIASSGTETPNRRTACAKWVITDPDARFVSIELTADEVYIIVEREENPLSKGRANTAGGASFLDKVSTLLKAKAASPASGAPRIYTGKYTVSKDSTVAHLINFGTLQMDLSPDKKSAAIKLHLEPDVPPFNGDHSRIYEFNAERAAEIASSENTDLLCRHWSYVEFLLNGDLWEPWNDSSGKWEPLGWQFPESKPQTTILFTKAGTCLQTTTVDGAETLTSTGRWKWADENENAINYTNGLTDDWMPDAVNVTLTETEFTTTEFLNSDTLITKYELLKR